jgi:hypothetical protein
MSTHTADFWPDDIGQTDLRTPVALLREQAAALGEKTRNVVTAEVESESVPPSDEKLFTYSLYLVAPAIRYRYQLLTIRHPITLYPISVTTPKMPNWAKVGSEQDFANWLKTVLASNETKMIIRALMAQSQ